MRQISDCVWEIDDRGKPDSVKPKVFLSDEMLPSLEPSAINQLVNVSKLPGCVASMAMPDVHTGYAFTIGHVAAFKRDNAVITPMGVGYDINCGVRLLKTDFLTVDRQLNPAERAGMDELIQALYKRIPSGFARSDELSLDEDAMADVFIKGPEYMLKRGYGTKKDIDVCEENGRMENARVDEHTILPKEVSGHDMSVYERGGQQMGTLGGGNHFLEIQQVTDIYNDEVAANFGLKKGMITVMIHSGSRGAGHQICEGHHKLISERMKNYYGDVKKLDDELSYVPLDSYEGKNYMDAMACGANYAWANRHMMGAIVREEFDKMYGTHVDTVYDVTHNIAKFEQHSLNGVPEDLLIIRKGATRAFCGGRFENPQTYIRYGHPVLIPGSMGTASYVLVGTYEGMQTTFGSVNHGAGRTMSRFGAKKKLKNVDVRGELAAKGITVMASGDIRDEAPQAYKDIDAVIDVDVRAGIGKLVARMVPIAVMKG